MKKILLTLAIFAMVFSTPYSKTKKTTESDAPDSYNEEDVTAIKVEKKEKKSAASSDPYNDKKMKPKAQRTFGQKLLGLNKFQEIESFSLYTKSDTGKMKLKDGSLIHRAGTDIGGFYCYYDTSAYAVQFAQQARGVLVSAINQYIDDFNNKKLDKNSKTKNTQNIYGTAEAYEEYGIAAAMLKHYARPKMQFGYAFIKGHPYFMIYAPKTKDLSYEKKSDSDLNWENTIAQRYYFTIAQAKRLANFLSDENISALYEASIYADVKDGDFDSYEEIDTPAQTE